MSMHGSPNPRPVVHTGPGRTKQSMREEADINFIVAKYQRTGMLEHLARGVPQYADVSQVGDYRTALENARAAEAFFLGLPAKLRAAFGNDVAEYLAALQDPAAAEKLEALADELYPSRRAAEAARASERASEASETATEEPSEPA